MSVVPAELGGFGGYLARPAGGAFRVYYVLCSMYTVLYMAPARHGLGLACHAAHAHGPTVGAGLSHAAAAHMWPCAVVVIVAVCGSIHSTPRIGAYLYGVYCLVLTHMTQVAGACCEEGMHGSYLGSWRCSCYSCPAGACRIWQLRALALAGVSSSPLPILRHRTEYLITHCARYNISYDMPGRRGHE